VAAAGAFLGRLLLPGILVIALLVLSVRVIPQLSAGELVAAAQAVSAAVSHEPAVEAALTGALRKAPPGQDPATRKSQLDKDVPAYEAALATIQSDEGRLAAAEQHLNLLGFVSLRNRAALSSQHQRVADTLSGVRQADEALTAGLHQAQLSEAIAGASLDNAALSAAMGRGDLTAADAAYQAGVPKLERAFSLAQSPDLAPGTLQYVSAFKDVVETSEKVVQAAQAKDQAALRTYNAQLQASARVLAAVDVAALEDWRITKYQPIADAYRAALRSAAESS